MFSKISIYMNSLNRELYKYLSIKYKFWKLISLFACPIGIVFAYYNMRYSIRESHRN